MDDQRHGSGTPPRAAYTYGPSGPPWPAQMRDARDTHGYTAPDALGGRDAQTAQRPDADVWARDGDEMPLGDSLHGLHGPGGNTASSAMEQRLWARHQVREFLRSVPRGEPDATVVIVRLDGATRLLTRGELTAAIERMRPRMRQIIRLAVEERWSRTRVCAYLQNISLKTLERDYVEGMDYLAQEL